MRELQTPTAEEIAHARRALDRYRRRVRTLPITAAERLDSEQRRRRMDCPHCNPTAKAMGRVRDQWVVAGIE